MNCPHCGKPIPSKLAAKALGYRMTRKRAAGALGKITSKAKAAAARENGKKGGRPRKGARTPHTSAETLPHRLSGSEGT